MPNSARELIIFLCFASPRSKASRFAAIASQICTTYNQPCSLFSSAPNVESSVCASVNKRKYSSCWSSRTLTTEWSMHRPAWIAVSAVAINLPACVKARFAMCKSSAADVALRCTVRCAVPKPFQAFALDGSRRAASLASITLSRRRESSRWPVASDG